MSYKQITYRFELKFELKFFKFLCTQLYLNTTYYCRNASATGDLLRLDLHENRYLLRSSGRQIPTLKSRCMKCMKCMKKI